MIGSSGSADAIPEPAVNANAAPPTAAANLVNDSLTISGYLSVSMHREKTATTSAHRLPSPIEATRPREQSPIEAVIAYETLDVTIRRSATCFARFALSEMRARAGPPARCPA